MNKQDRFAGLRRILGLGTAAVTTPAAEDEPADPPADPEDEPADPPADPEDPPADPEDEPADPPADPPADAVEADTADPQYQAGYNACARRFAAVLVSEEGRANLELATDLLADTDMAPEQIVGYCGRHKGVLGARQARLARTPNPDTGAAAGAGGEAGDDAATARKEAAKRVNRNLRGGGGGRTSARARRGDQPKKGTDK